jgi:hypothetical protein
MSSSDMKLFAVYLGGRAPRCNTELHDVVFVIGSSIERCYERIMDKWFGDSQRVHLDSWLELDVVDGHRISLSAQPFLGPSKLFFVNLGAAVQRPGPARAQPDRASARRAHPLRRRRAASARAAHPR